MQFEAAVPVGDIDGDGAAELIIQTSWYQVAEDPLGALERHGQSLERVFAAPVLNLYYGGEALETPR